jgi:two-component sensor histidine kinase
MSLATYTQAQDKREADSLRRVLNNTKTDTGRIHVLIDISDYYHDNNDLTNTGIYLRKADLLNKKWHNVGFQNQINLYFASIYCAQNPDHDAKTIFLPLIADCRKSGDKKNECRGWSYLALFLAPGDKSIPYKLICYQHAFLLSRQLNIDEDEKYFLIRIADIHFQQLKYDLAEAELLQILKDPKAAPGSLMLSSYYLTVLYTSKAEYDKALLYAMKTVTMMQMTKDSTNASAYYGQVAHLNYILKNYPLSLYWAKKWLNHDIITNSPITIYNASDYVVRCLLEEKKTNEALKFISGIQAKYKAVNGNDRLLLAKSLGDCYSALKKYDLAEKSYLEMIKIDPGGIFGELHASSTKALAYAALASLYIQTEQYKKVKTYSLEALKYDKVTGQVNYLESVHELLFRADSALGNYQSAITHLQESNKLKDSMFNVAKNKQIEVLNISYQTEERKKDFTLVQNKEKFDRVQLQHSETTRNWIIAGSGLLLIIAGLLYRQSRLRRKSNELITQKNEVITHKNELLQSLVEEKEWLLKEVHHRVKNNLHTVICLLESQAAYLQNDALEAIEKSQHRIYTMSLIHQKLYQSDDVKMIDMSVYIPELVKYLSDSFDVSNRVYFNLAIEPINLNPAQAIPLALLINEALTNSIKYAFPDGRRGEIAISLIDTGEQYKLVLADNGVGLPQKEQKAVDSLGMDLMKGLAKEVRGNIYIENNNGVKITVIFEHDALNDVDILGADYFISQPGEA